jgi:hypothetical protein
MTRVAALVVLLVAGCARVPQPAAQSAASSQAPAARRATVTQALRSDPPPPGQASDGWRGLSPAPEASELPDPHAHHHGHEHGH